MVVQGWKSAQERYGWTDWQLEHQIYTSLHGYQLWAAMEAMAEDGMTALELVDALRARVETGEFSDPP